jgi:hypothetical protein
MIKLVDTAQRRGATEHHYRALRRVRVEVEPFEEWEGASSEEGLGARASGGGAPVRMFTVGSVDLYA